MVVSHGEGRLWMAILAEEGGGYGGSVEDGERERR